MFSSTISFSAFLSPYVFLIFSFTFINSNVDSLILPGSCLEIFWQLVQIILKNMCVHHLGLVRKYDWYFVLQSFSAFQYISNNWRILYILCWNDTFQCTFSYFFAIIVFFPLNRLSSIYFAYKLSGCCRITLEYFAKIHYA